MQYPTQGNPAWNPPQRINKNYHITHRLPSASHCAGAEELPCPSSAQHFSPASPFLASLTSEAAPSSLLHLEMF